MHAEGDDQARLRALGEHYNKADVGGADGADAGRRDARADDERGPREDSVRYPRELELVVDRIRRGLRRGTRCPAHPGTERATAQPSTTWSRGCRQGRRARFRCRLFRADPPIGRINRKGRTTCVAGPNDPGSP